MRFFPPQIHCHGCSRPYVDTAHRCSGIHVESIGHGVSGLSWGLDRWLCGDCEARLARQGALPAFRNMMRDGHAGVSLARYTRAGGDLARMPVEV